MDYYLLFLWGGVDIGLYGPYQDIESRDNKAREFWKKHGDECGYFQISATKGSKINVSSYSGSFFEENDNAD
ncbi:hypothetical protein LCGC14_0579630 [marine sediment metagenome]|uniref:Uncharacterized protein n=1 Tax=marine sediment metagenome TaxID=412755 RepID=A0A0F9U2V4_9ZZZZ